MKIKEFYSYTFFNICVCTFFFLIINFYPLAAKDNEFTVTIFGATEGLIDNTINCIYQDYQGFIWFGTGSGLLKYDGYSFKTYQPSNADSNSIKQNFIQDIFEDKFNNLWIITPSAFSKYIRETNSFKNYTLDKFIEVKQNYSILSVSNDSEGKLWILIKNKGVFVFDTQNEILTPLKKINETFGAERNKFLLKTEKENQYSTTLTFSEDYFSDTLEYKYFLNTKDGNVVREAGLNRQIILSGGLIDLTADEFRLSGYSTIRKLQSYPLQPLKTKTEITFNVNVNHLRGKNYNIESLGLKGNVLPLTWFDSDQDPDILTKGKDNELWLGTTTNGIYLYDIKTEKIKHFSKISKYGMTNWISGIFKDRHDNIWITCKDADKIFQYNRSDQTFSAYNYLSNNPGRLNPLVTRITDAPDQTIWFTLLSREVQYFKNNIVKRLNYTFASTLTSIFVDRSGIVWVGTQSDGIFEFNPNILKFSRYPKPLKEHNPFFDKAFYTIYEDKNGIVWLGGDIEPIIGYNKKTNRFTGRLFKFKNPAGWVNHMYEDIFGNIWFAGDGLHRYDPVKNTLTSFFNNGKPNSLPATRTIRILQGSRKNLWITTFEGILIKYNQQTGQFTGYSTFEDHQSWYDGAKMTYLAEDDSGFIWIATKEDKGILRFNPKTGLLKGFLKEPTKTDLGRQLIIDKKNRIWVGGNLKGLYLFNQKTEKESLIVNSDIYINTSIRGLQDDDNGDIWISTTDGLVKYSPDEGRFKKYYKEDGLQDNEFSHFAHYKSASGELLFGGKKGFNAFYPDSIKESTYHPPVVFTELKINNQQAALTKDVANKYISVADTIFLDYNQNDITLYFAALDFSLPQRNMYTYILENFDRKWRTESNRNYAEYTNLDPGTYIFNVKGSNSDAVWNKNPAVLTIIIYPPWWQTWWAYSCYLMILLGFVYTVRRYELNRLHFKNQAQIEATKLQERENVDRLKSTFFTNISHEFRTPLTLIIGPLNKLISEEKEVSKINVFKIMKRNAGRLLGLINQLLDIAKIESGNMQLSASKGDIAAFVKGILMSFHSLAEHKNIAVGFSSQKEKIDVYFDREKAEKIFTNILSNAFKFTPQGGEVEVNIHIPLNPPSKGETINAPLEGGLRVVSITITNTGPGIPAEKLPHVFDRFYQADASMVREQEGSGIGLALTKELVELHHGTISVTSEPGEQTMFTVILPLGSVHLKPQEIIETPPKTEETDIKIVEIESIPETNIPRGDRSEKTVILVVEDNADMSNYINDTLKDKYRVEQAFDGETGLTAARDIIPDLIISDLMMPKKDGYQLCSEVKQDQITSHIPVILLTAKAERKDKLQGLETGADDYLIKPFDSKELLIRIKNLIEQRRHLRERFSNTIKVEPKDITVTSIDAEFLQKSMNIVEENMNNENFNVEMMSEFIGLSRRQLYHKIKALTDYAPTDFILNIRLKKAASLLSRKAGNVSEIAYTVGFNNLSYFARAFKKQFHCTPSRYQNPAQE